MTINLPDKRRLIFLLAFVFFFCLAVFSAGKIISGWLEYAASNKEYEGLRQIYEPPDTDEEEDQGADSGTNAEASLPPSSVDSEPPRDPSEVNPDYIGWLRIRNTGISYPMVKGADNEKYLYTSFEGYYNRLGAIFMDYRCAEDFEAYHSIIYGHNMRNGTMFSSLDRFLENGYLDNHREIVITSPDGQNATWQIFAARKTDVKDFAYRLTFYRPEDFAVFAGRLGAPKEATRILTLSTCTSGAKEERILVHAFIEDIVPEEPIPEEITPEETIPEAVIPEVVIPEVVIPEVVIPEVVVTPEEIVPEEVIPEETVPEEAIPEETAPEETIPEEIIPEEPVPEEIIPEEPIPEEIIPEETIPEETAPGETIPEEAIPEEATPEETVP